MVRFIILFAVVLGFLNIACEPMDSGVRDRSQYYYVNLSDYQVKLSVSSSSPLDYEILDSIIPVGDTVRFNNLEPEGQTDNPLGRDVSVKLIFYSVPQSCLKYEGEIANDSSSNDIRSSTTYIQTNHPAVGGLVKRCYTISDVHYQKGSPCN
ncbi:MAG: hypothetical protein MUF22_07680 [Chitinispirillaceae bacterium]|jgi:hypothetical protein|nr:hypothetical protein [Chitinispirillaceae bacterium]